MFIEKPYIHAYKKNKNIHLRKIKITIWTRGLKTEISILVLIFFSRSLSYNYVMTKIRENVFHYNKFCKIKMQVNMDYKTKTGANLKAFMSNQSQKSSSKNFLKL